MTICSLKLFDGIYSSGPFPHPENFRVRLKDDFETIVLELKMRSSIEVGLLAWATTVVASSLAGRQDSGVSPFHFLCLLPTTHDLPA